MPKIAGSIYQKIACYIVVLFLFATVNIYSQTPENLQVFNNLVDSSVSTIIKQDNLSGRSFVLEKNISPAFTVFTNRVASAFNKYFAAPEQGNKINLSYSIEEAKVVYTDMFRDGFLGTYYVERSFSLKGNYLIQNESASVKHFAVSVTDTVQYEDLKKYENPAFPFTQGVIPAEPFWSSLLEPAVAIGSAAVAVYLFFSIRSK